MTKKMKKIISLNSTDTKDPNLLSLPELPSQALTCLLTDYQFEISNSSSIIASSSNKSRNSSTIVSILSL